MNKHLLLFLLGFGSFGVSSDCIGKTGKDFHDFCAWHAGIGKYQ